MADIRAFRAHRYDQGRSGPLSDVVAPPYDVIDSALNRELLARSPHNVVRIDLPAAEAGDDESRNRYTRSAALLRDWIASGIVQQDTARSLYVCHQEYQADGETHVRRGFFARVRLEPFGTGGIYPHEQTFPGPKEDRLKLMRSTGMNLSPVFGMFPDPANKVQDTLDEAVRRMLPIEATDHLGTVSRLWPVTDQALVSTVVGLMGPKPIYIADGHHRYETCLSYLAERKAAGEVADADAPAHFTLMMLVGMNDPGLLIMPTHRLVSGLPGFTSADAIAMLRNHFTIEPAVSAAAAWETILADGSQGVLGFGTLADGRWHVGRLVRPEVMDELAPERSPAWRCLGVSILHRLVLDKLVAERIGGRAPCQYVHRLDEVTAALDAGSCDLAVLVPATTMRHVEIIANGGETMPQKSTYFYPKLLTGLLFNSLKAN